MRERKKSLPSIRHRSMTRINPKSFQSTSFAEEKVYSSFVRAPSSITNEAYFDPIRNLNLEQQLFLYEILHREGRRLFDCSLKHFLCLIGGASSGKSVTLKATFQFYGDSTKVLLTKMLNISPWLLLPIRHRLPGMWVALPFTLCWGLNSVPIVLL